jgi:hypothetical protein
MKRRKKKVSTQQTKQEYGARLKIYKQKIFYFLKLIDCEDVQALINEDTLQDSKNSRSVAPSDGFRFIAFSTLFRLGYCSIGAIGVIHSPPTDTQPHVHF